jgi:hypothetical protein
MAMSAAAKPTVVIFVKVMARITRSVRAATEADTRAGEEADARPASKLALAARVVAAMSVDDTRGAAISR